MLIVGDSIMRNIRFFNSITRCFPGATILSILEKIPELLENLPSSVQRIIVHVGTNDSARGHSEVVKKDFNQLFSFLKNCGLSIFISGPIPTFGHGDVRFSRLLYLHHWLQAASTSHGFVFINNFNLFWNRPPLYRADGLHPSYRGRVALSTNIHHAVRYAAQD